MEKRKKCDEMNLRRMTKRDEWRSDEIKNEKKNGDLDYMEIYTSLGDAPPFSVAFTLSFSVSNELGHCKWTGWEGNSNGSDG